MIYWDNAFNDAVARDREKAAEAQHYMELCIRGRQEQLDEVQRYQNLCVQGRAAQRKYSFPPVTSCPLNLTTYSFAQAFAKSPCPLLEKKISTESDHNRLLARIQRPPPSQPSSRVKQTWPKSSSIDPRIPARQRRVIPPPSTFVQTLAKDEDLISFDEIETKENRTDSSSSHPPTRYW